MKHIILMGFMGCGKSTIGKKLSDKLNISLIDTDSLIEQSAGMCISEIFSKHGEVYFRALEATCLDNIKNELEYSVISLGGGTPLKEENRKRIKELGHVIYLKASPETIYKRTRNSNTRPLLQCDDPLSKIKTLLHERDSIYESLADIVILVDGKEVYEVVDQIVEALSNKDEKNS